MNIELRIDEIEVGTIVEIDHKIYMVQQLPSCIEDYDRRLGHRFYLQLLEGYGFYDYPNTLKQLKVIIANANGRVYGKKTYKLLLMPVS